MATITYSITSEVVDEMDCGGFGDTQLIVAPGDRGVSHAFDALGANLWLNYSDATNDKIRPWNLNSSGLLAAGIAEVTLGAGSSPSLYPLPTGDLSLCYVTSGNATHARYSVARGRFQVQTVTAATLVTHDFDRMGRLIMAVYNSAWYVVVGILNSDGTTWTFSSPVSMGLTATAARGSMRCMPDGSLSFAYLDGSGNATLTRCRSLTNAGAGTWS